MYRKAPLLVFLALIVAVLVPPPVRAESQEAVTLKVRGDARLRFLLLHPAGPPVAAVVLYPGGAGNIGIKKDGSIKYGNNFLVRSRDLFAKQGFLTAVVDRPSDWAGSDKDQYRLSAAHAEDAAAIARALRDRTAAPIWFIGTSRGTISVASIASRLGRDRIAGIVLTSSVTAPGKRSPQTVQDADLAGIAVPVLILGHGGDDCYVTPWSEQEDLAGRFKHAAAVETIRIDGGDPGNLAEPCGPISHHGFLGQEKDVVGRIAVWIRQHQTSGRR
jgi:predicted alpha/beta-hydrolase family hydrolase